MAAATLVLGVPQDVALEGTPLDRRLVNLPAGTRWLRGRLRGTEDWFLEVPPKVLTDASARTAGFETYAGDGTRVRRAPDSGLGASVLRSALAVAISSDLGGGTIELTAMEESG